jgi:benzoyl-CoA reductase/2-hydroxyglutaryl-CoA dehydratase subunit BcrC/BadD/HgdB
MAENYRKLLIEIIDQYFAPFKEKQKKLVWLSAFAPSEIIKSFDVDIFYPEIHAALLAPRKVGPELLSKCASLGFSDDLCSYMRMFVGGLEFEGSLRFGKIPSPDALVVTNNQCGTLFAMWKILASRYEIPLYVLDLPAYTPNREEYVLSQMKKLVEFMEKLTSTVLDESKLVEQTANSSTASLLWGELCTRIFRGEVEITINSLVNNYFLPMTIAHSGLKTVAFLKDILQGLNNSKRDDKYKRIYWFGYPFWFSKEKFPDLSQFGGKIVANNYLKWWDIPINNHKKALGALANAYANTYLNRSLESRISELEKEDLEKYNIEGIIVHSNFSCKRDAVVSTKAVQMLSEKGFSVVEVQGDMCDKDKFQERQFLLRVEAFVQGL